MKAPIILFISALLASFVSHGQGGMLYGADNQGNYFSINSTTGATSVINNNFKGTCAVFTRPPGVVTAIGYGPVSGTGFAQEYDGCGSGFKFNALTGALTSVLAANVGNPEDSTNQISR